MSNYFAKLKERICFVHCMLNLISLKCLQRRYWARWTKADSRASARYTCRPNSYNSNNRRYYPPRCKRSNCASSYESNWSLSLVDGQYLPNFGANGSSIICNVDRRTSASTLKDWADKYFFQEAMESNWFTFPVLGDHLLCMGLLCRSSCSHVKLRISRNTVGSVLPLLVSLHDCGLVSVNANLANSCGWYWSANLQVFFYRLAFDSIHYSNSRDNWGVLYRRQPSVASFVGWIFYARSIPYEC